MSERKIRLTLSSKLYNGVGALIDVDFNSENLDVDLDVAAEYGVSTLIKEYTVSVAAGIYNLDISYKNDDAVDNNADGVLDADRNLVIEKIEFANNGIDYEYLIINPSNTNLEQFKHYNAMGWIELINSDYNPAIPKTPENHPQLKNPNYNPSLPVTDDNYEDPSVNPGSNPLFSYQLVLNPVTIYNNETATFQIEFS